MASSKNVLKEILPEVLAARDLLERDDRAMLRGIREAQEEEEARKAAEYASMMRHPELHLPLKSEPVEIKEKNVLTDPHSWLNTGLKNLVGNATSVILGEPSGNNVVDMGVSNVPGVGAGAILAAGGMPGILDLTGLGALKNVKNLGKAFDIIKNLRTYSKMDPGGYSRMISAIYDDFTPDEEIFRKFNNANDYFKGMGYAETPAGKVFKGLVEEKYDRDVLRDIAGVAEIDDKSFNKFIDILDKTTPNGGEARKSMETILEELEKEKAQRELAAAEAERQRKQILQSTQNLSTFTSNPKKAAQEIVDGNLSIEDYLGDNLSKIRPGQRKQVEDQLRKLGVDIPEEIVEQAPVVVKKEKPKEVQLPKSEKQRLAAIETAQKTWKKKPNDVFKSIDKGRTPEDYFKGAENIPEDFADKYAAHVAEKEGRKAEQAAQQEAARAQAEIDRQNAQATQKQLEREAAEKASRDAIARERERIEQDRALAELFARRNSPEGVLEAGWKPSEHPPMGGRPYPEYTVSDLDKRNHFFRDSVATQILKGFSPENPVTGEKMKDLFGPNPAKVVRHRGTNYDQMMANFYRELEDAKKAGRYTGPTSGADAMDRAMYEDSFRKQYDRIFSDAIDELFFRRPTR